MREFMAWCKWAMESMKRQTIALNKSYIVSNVFTGGMDFIWNYGTTP
jgi:hypothetical protein